MQGASLTATFAGQLMDVSGGDLMEDTMTLDGRSFSLARVRAIAGSRRAVSQDLDLGFGGSQRSGADVWTGFDLQTNDNRCRGD